MTTTGFFSAVLTDDGRITIRARSRSDLDGLLVVVDAPVLSEVTVSPTRDYRYRVFCTVPDVENVVMPALVKTIDYGNFKEAVGKVSPRHAKLYGKVWSLMGDLQPRGPYGWGDEGTPPVPADERDVQEAADRR
jgi:hypothetical protein